MKARFLLLATLLSTLGAFPQEAEVGAQPLSNTTFSVAKPGKVEPPVATPNNADTPKWVANAIALINLALVIYVFIHTKRDKRADHEVSRKREVATFWIQDFILKPNMAIITDFFDRYEESLAKPQNGSTGRSTVRKVSTDAASAILEFKTEFHQVRTRVIEPLKVVSPEFDRLSEVMEKIEDLVTTELMIIPGLEQHIPDQPPRAESASTQMRKFRLEFFSSLYAAQEKHICGLKA